MYFSRISISTFVALAVLFTKYSTAQTNGSNLTVQLYPNPSDTPDFAYNFNVAFTASCSAAQRDAILATMNNIAGLADRVKLWETDLFHDWDDEVFYWFGSKTKQNVQWIKNNFLRMSAAMKNRKSAWINTWLYISCGFNQGVSALTCNSYNNYFNFNNNYGFFRVWDTIYWNFCPDFWTAPDLVSKVKDTTNDPDKNIHWMENYCGTREQWIWPGILAIRSIGIKGMKMDYASRIQTPGGSHKASLYTRTTLVNFMSYFYTAMSIAIPEAFNTQARPIISEEYDDFFINLDNSNGSILDPPSTPASPDQERAGTEIFNSGSATAAGPPSTASLALPLITGTSSVPFPSLTDAAHTNTENCFPFLPSISAQGSPTLECDCMTTTAPLTIQGSSTSCALSNTLFAINPFRLSADSATSGPAPTATSGPAPPATSSPQAPVPTSAPPPPPSFSVAEATTLLSNTYTTSMLTYCTGNDQSSYLTTNTPNPCPYTATPTDRILPTATPSQLWCAAYYTDSQHCCTVQTGGNGLGGIEQSSCFCNNGKVYTLDNAGCCPFPVQSSCPRI